MVTDGRIAFSWYTFKKIFEKTIKIAQKKPVEILDWVTDKFRWSVYVSNNSTQTTISSVSTVCVTDLRIVHTKSQSLTRSEYTALISDKKLKNKKIDWTFFFKGFS